jgi:hypothetical protein
MDTNRLQILLQQTAVGLSYHDKPVMEPVWVAFEGKDYPAAVTAMIDLAAQGAIALHYQTWTVLNDAANHYGLDKDPLSRAWLLPDKPNLETGVVLELAVKLIDKVSDETGDPLRFLREAFRCGEWMMAVEDLTAVIDREKVALTVAEQTALKIVLWHLSPAWFAELPLRPSRGSL